MSEYPDIVVDTLDRVHIVWIDWSLGQLLWSFCGGDTWTTPSVVSGDVQACGSARIALDPSNRMHLVWHNLGDAQIWYNVYDGTSWSVPFNITTVTGNTEDAWPDIAIDSEGNIHVVWLHYDYSANLDIFYSKYDGTSWSAPINLSNSEAWSCGPKIAIDSDNRPHVVYEERKGGSHLYYTFFDGTNWSTPYQLVTQEGSYPAIAIDTHSGIICVTWNLGGIWYSFYNGTSWSLPGQISPSGVSSYLAIDSMGTFHLVWGHGVWPQCEVYYSKHTLTGIESTKPQDIPVKSELRQNSPNPFVSETLIPYQLSKNGNVTLTISDLAGRIVKKIDLGYKHAGSYTFKVSADILRKVGAHVGIYFYRLDAGSFTATRKMILLQ